MHGCACMSRPHCIKPILFNSFIPDSFLCSISTGIFPGFLDHQLDAETVSVEKRIRVSS